MNETSKTESVMDALVPIVLIVALFATCGWSPNCGIGEQHSVDCDHEHDAQGAPIDETTSTS